MVDAAIVILAAGGSRRMGKPKQLLLYHGVTFVEHAFQVAQQVFESQVCIVLGAAAETITAAVPMIKDYTIINKNWQQGMGTSIGVGLQAIVSKFPELTAVMFMTADQLFVTSSHLRNMLGSFNAGTNKIIVSSYQDTEGTPALFGKKYFNELLQLKTDKGAKDIIREYSYDVSRLKLEKGEIDIDTPEQYHAIINQVDDHNDRI